MLNKFRTFSLFSDFFQTLKFSRFFKKPVDRDFVNDKHISFIPNISRQNNDEPDNYTLVNKSEAHVYPSCDFEFTFQNDTLAILKVKCIQHNE